MCQPEFTLNNDHNAELIENNNENLPNPLPNLEESDSQPEERQQRYFFEINVELPQLMRHFNNLRLGNDEDEADDSGNSLRPEPSTSNQLFSTTIYDQDSEDDLPSESNSQHSPRLIFNINLHNEEVRVNNSDDEATILSINRGQSRRRRHRSRYRERRDNHKVVKQLKKMNRVLRKTNTHLRHIKRLIQRNVNLRTPAQEQNSSA